MRKASLFIVLAAASFAVGAQQEQSKRNGGAASQQADKKAEQADPTIVERARADGAAGGTAPVAPQQRKAVGAGAGPHLHETAPSPQKLPRDEPVEPPK
jgi:hypothetical protein